MNLSNQEKPAAKIIWDLPTRLFHWMLVITVTTAWLTSSDLYFEAHLFAGYLLLLLILFRLVWGVVGNRYAQFRHFAHSWPAVRTHLKQLLQGDSSHADGHNPAGGWMIFLLLGLLTMISLSGLLTLGGEEQMGPLQGWISIATGAALHALHEQLAWALLLLIPIHLAGVLVERLISKRKLVQAMVTGTYSGRITTKKSRGVLLVSGALLSTPVFALWLSLSTEEHNLPLYPNHNWRQAAGYTLWKEECGSCHTLHHPSLLPVRSWHKMIDEDADHFGEDLDLGPDTATRIQHFLKEHAAEQAMSEAAWKISNSIPADKTPLQITATPYWQAQHRDLSTDHWSLPSVGSQMNCDGCHQDAESGTFHDRAIMLPGV